MTFESGDAHLSYLPLAHVYERTVVEAAQEQVVQVLLDQISVVRAAMVVPEEREFRIHR